MCLRIAITAELKQHLKKHNNSFVNDMIRKKVVRAKRRNEEHNKMQLIKDNMSKLSPESMKELKSEFINSFK